MRMGEGTRTRRKCLATEEKCIYFPQDGRHEEGGRVGGTVKDSFNEPHGWPPAKYPPRNLRPEPAMMTACCLRGAQVPQECGLAIDDRPCGQGGSAKWIKETG